jgi:hypothetical protein
MWIALEETGKFSQLEISFGFYVFDVALPSLRGVVVTNRDREFGHGRCKAQFFTYVICEQSFPLSLARAPINLALRFSFKDR